MGFFPVPRHELPRVVVTREEHHARKAQMQRMLESLVDDYEYYAEANGRQVDSRRWKASTSRDRLKLFKERKHYSNIGGGGGEGGAYASSSGKYTSSDSDLTNRPGAASSAASATMTFSEESADALRMTLMVGECAGRMENAMNAVIAHNHAELALVDIFLHEDVADCAILARMEEPTAHDPYHFLGYKWFVRKSPTTAYLVKHRDSVYVESSGLTRTRSGEQLGYHLMHSVDLMDFPEMRDRNCLRSSQSIRALYRQRPGNIVEVFIMGNLQLSGMIRGPIASMFIQETLFNMPKVIDCGEAKRLTAMVLELRHVRAQRIHERALQASESCSLCRQPKKRFGGGGAIDMCDVCGLDVCGKCRLPKRVYQSEGILGRFLKIACCKTCVLAAKNARPHGTDTSSDITTSANAASGSGSSSRSNSIPRNGSSIRTLAEQMEIRHRAASSSGSATSSHANQLISSSEEMPVAPMRRPSTAPGSVSSSTKELTRLTAAMSMDSTTSAYHTPSSSPVMDLETLAEPMISAQSPPLPLSPPDSAQSPPPTATSSSSSSPSQQSDMYLKMLELQRKAQHAYDTTKQNEMYLDGQKL